MSYEKMTVKIKKRFAKRSSRFSISTNKSFGVNVNKKIQLDATVCRHLFTAKSLYMFRASQRPSSGVLKTVTAISGVGHMV
jgi:hypothetical protein